MQLCVKNWKNCNLDETQAVVWAVLAVFIFFSQNPIVYHWLGVWEYFLAWKATLISCSGTYPERTSNFCVHPSSSSIKLASAICSKTTYALPANRLLSP